MQDAPAQTPWTWIAPALITALIFAGLPLLDSLFHQSGERLTLRDVTRAVPPAPPPPPPPPERPPDERPPTPRLARERPRLLMPMQASLSLQTAPGNLAGDFALDLVFADTAMGTNPEEYIFEVEDLDVPLQPLQRIRPVYPPRARNLQLAGTVELEFVVTPEGTVQGERVVAAIPEGVFEEAALRAVRRWTFVPGTRSGQPIAVRVRQNLTFSLEH
jgi:protein TonB